LPRLFLIVLFLCALGAAAGAQPVAHHGVVEVAFGYVRDADGTVRSLKGLKLPYYAEPIQAAPVGSTRPVPEVWTDRSSTTVYNADSGTGYGIVDGADPSSLDDLVLAGGVGVPWKHLTFGVDIGAQRNFLIRWIVYDTYVQGLGPGVSAFTQSAVWDFGVIYPATAPGTYKITIDVAAAGIAVPTSTIYMAQQFRAPNPNGQGAFDTAMKTVYNSSGPVSVGTSQNNFWYDHDPLDGIYDETETDWFGEQSFANHLRAITVAGTQDNLVPATATVEQGLLVGGDLIDLWYSDNQFYSVRNAAPGDPVAIVLESQSPSASILSMTFRAEAKSLQQGVLKVELFNYQTNAYDEVATLNLSNVKQSTQVTITNNPSKYVNSANRRVRARLVGSPPPLRSIRTWILDVDMAGWTITR
jgi:hypothetical protein